MVGILGANATASADFNLFAHIAMGLALLGGMMLARARHYRAHMFCQSAVMLLNIPLILLIMFPSFHNNVQPGLPGGLGDKYYAVATVHAAIGAVAQLLGLWIVLVAATKLVPRRFRFRRYKLWMRTELTLWWIVLAIGVGVYAVWYAPASASVKTGLQGNNGFVVNVKNFAFAPKETTVKTGTTVTWVVSQGPHTVTSDRGLFRSGILSSGQKFSFRFAHSGTYRYHCELHGGAGGAGMAGMVVVKSSG
jgi:plastocyanin